MYLAGVFVPISSVGNGIVLYLNFYDGVLY